jgi:hypothetical protein
MTRSTKPLPAFEVFLLRFLRGLAVFGVLVAGSLTLGAFGYHRFENLPWLDAYLNASMILAGMGPLENPQSHDGKLFAIFYSLFSGVMFLTAVAVLLGPILHRFLHRLHLDMEEDPPERR